MKKLTERHVQAIWYDSRLRPARLVTRRGSSVIVVSPGEWNSGPGPDFRRAVLEIGRKRRRLIGDVEVHLHPGDWDRHCHGKDPAYRDVVAHVTWGCGPDPRGLPPEAVSIWLGRFVMGDPQFDPSQIDLGAYPSAILPLGKSLCEIKIGHRPDVVERELIQEGRRRIEKKGDRLKERLLRQPRLQLYYEEVMTAFGYVHNTEAFRRVANRVPLSALPKEVGAAQTALVVAGAFERWERIGQRPANEPEVRLRNAAEVFLATPILAFVDATDFSRASCSGMVASICCPRRRDALGRMRRFLGRGRAAAVVANVIVPFAIAEGRLKEVPDWLPAEDLSAPVRLMAKRLFGPDHNPVVAYARNGVLVQGLIGLYQSCCQWWYPDCSRCPKGVGAHV